VEGADFRFVQKVAFLNPADKYAAPVQLPFTFLQPGRLEVQVDTSGVAAGEYALALFQTDNQPHRVPIRVLSDPPKLTTFLSSFMKGSASFHCGFPGKAWSESSAWPPRDYESKPNPSSPSRTSSGSDSRPSHDSEGLRRAGSRARGHPGCAAETEDRVANSVTAIELPISLRAGELPAGLQ
jgi:hypothetical protein